MKGHLHSDGWLWLLPQPTITNIFPSFTFVVCKSLWLRWMCNDQFTIHMSAKKLNAMNIWSKKTRQNTKSNAINRVEQTEHNCKILHTQPTEAKWITMIIPTNLTLAHNEQTWEDPNTHAKGTSASRWGFFWLDTVSLTIYSPTCGAKRFS